MDDQFALWLTVIMLSTLTVGVTWILNDRIVELRHRMNRLEIDHHILVDVPSKAEKFWEKTPKREWVGLTDDEIGEICHKSPPDSHNYARDIEAKLKEKNT